MLNLEVKNRFINLANELKIKLDEESIEKYDKYLNLLLEWNEKINLTAITDVEDIILKHFIDSLTTLKYIDDNSSIVDVGTGAGFPGIPIAILKEKCSVSLVDSLNKRVIFLNEVIENLNLNNVKTFHSRAEDFGQSKEGREKFDISISRAVANLSTLVEYLLPLVKVGGKCICMKGPGADLEIESAKFAIKELGGQIVDIEKLVLPDSDIERTIIIIKKIKSTQKKYPRKAGLPAKNPIKGEL